jgi:penicillin-binding protein 1C
VTERRARWLRRGRRAAVGGAVCALLLILLRILPHAPLSDGVPLSSAVYDRQGRLLRLGLAADQLYRLWTPLAEIAPPLVEATLLYEDRQFFRHPGVDPVALVRAAFATYGGGGRRGGSTLTMQLARRLYGIPSHTVGGKLKQMAYALGLELRHGKREILEAYLNLVPYGGNVEGVGAASLIYFRKPPKALLPAEALTLAVIPQNPSRRGPAEGKIPARLTAARAELSARWNARHPDRVEALPAALHHAGELPFLAPHFAEAILAAAPAARTVTTLDLRLQRLVERHLGGYIGRNRRLGLDNAAALLVDHRTLEVRAAVGSADFFEEKIAGQVDGTRARRSPGSTLKPFVYALGLEQGVIHPATMLRDVPRAFGAYSPENFDGRYAGPLSAKDALIRSRNVPALAVAAQLGGPGLYQFLTSAGVSLPQPESHYGLGLALGTGEVTMEELVTLYATLANGGVLHPLRTVSDGRPLGFGTRMLSEESAYLVLDMLEESPRPSARLASAAPVRLPVAWKTGTSWGFRDAWTVGVFGPYVLAVWVGNFSGESNPAFVGVQAAAPLFFELVDSLQAHDRTQVVPRRRPSTLRRVQVCALSGGLPTPSCPHARPTWFIPGRSPIEPCHIHRTFALDGQGRRTCGVGGVRSEVFEVWPSDLGKLFAAAGLPRRAVPPLAPGCQDEEGQPPRISSPLSGVTYTVRPGGSEEAIALQAAVDGDSEELFWFVDDAFVGRARGGTTVFWRPQAGHFTVRAVDDRGRSDARPIRIEALR